MSKQIHSMYEDKISDSLKIVYVSISNDFYNFLISAQGENNEDSSSSISLFGDSSSSK